MVIRAACTDHVTGTDRQQPDDLTDLPVSVCPQEGYRVSRGSRPSPQSRLPAGRRTGRPDPPAGVGRTAPTARQLQRQGTQTVTEGAYDEEMFRNIG